MKFCVRKYMGQGLKRDQALELAEISKDQFYYQPKAGNRGRPASKETKCFTEEGFIKRPNNEVITEIKEQKRKPDLNYGYRKMTYHLQQQGYLINHKKVYRLMKQHSLLEPKKVKGNKTYVK